MIQRNMNLILVMTPLKKLLDKIQWKPKEIKKLQTKRKSQKYISQKNILAENNLKLNDLEIKEEEDEQILYGPPKFYNSIKMKKGNFITTFQGNHNNLYFPVCDWSVFEVASISEFWGV